MTDTQSEGVTPSREALDWAAERWGQDPGGLSATPLPGDASRRRYTRLDSGDETRILLESPDPVENAAWFLEGRRLLKEGFPLPEIMAWNLERGFFLVEDLGDVHLSDLEPPPVSWEGGGLLPSEGAAGGAPKREGEGGDHGGGDGGPAADSGFDPETEFACACRKAAQVLAALHDRGWQCLAPVADAVAPPYDAEFVLAHEWSYFLDGARLMGMEGTFERELAQEGRKIAALAASERERSFIHRDFQSRNVLVRDGEVYLIDWQGGRLGPPFYDLASFVFDPYTELTLAAREDIAYAYLAARVSPHDTDDWRGRTRFFGLVRLMQAAGAYAHLARARGKPNFLRYLPRAVWRARQLARDMPEGLLPGLCSFLDDYLARLPGMLGGT
ncbi:MAG: phosphotransferase [Deltaproteobacteria bacterium]|jgi:aminoglycoside/choline kinase family phosphotransferase|nr:phosphotransferase [Deltaproteobacteria bacterium]